MKKKLSILLAALMLASSLAACGSDGGSAPASTTAAPADIAETAAETEYDGPPVDEFGRELLPSSLPDDLDFGGKTVTIWQRAQDHAKIVWVAEENGEIINDAIYKSNRAVEEKLNVKLEMVVPADGDNTKYQNMIKSAVQAGDASFDIAGLYAYYGASLITNGYFYNLLDTPYLDLESIVWNHDFIDQVSMFGGLYMIVGDISLSAIRSVFCMFFNKKNLDNYYSDIDLYQEVKDGSWTVDRFTELSRNVYSDLNGNGQKDIDDFYSAFIPTSSIPTDAYQAALDLPLTVKDEEGIPQLVYDQPRVAEGYQKIFNLLYNTDGIYQDSNTQEAADACFDGYLHGRSIFVIHVLSGTGALRDLEDDYGVLPVFKFDEAQESYKSAVQDGYSPFTINTVCPDIEMVSATLQAMSEQFYENVTPSYFEIALKRKYARADEDSEMYDIILAGRSFNFGVVYSEALDNLVHQWRVLLAGKKDTWQSTIDKLMPKTQKRLDKLLAKLEEMGG